MALGGGRGGPMAPPPAPPVVALAPDELHGLASALAAGLIAADTAEAEAEATGAEAKAAETPESPHATAEPPPTF
jgi:hypothetical protein